MKKTIRNFLVTGLLVITSIAYGQTNSTTPFVSNVLPPIPTALTQTSGVNVSIIDGKMNGQTAYSLMFENTGNKTVTFTWTLKDRNGNVVGTPQQMTMLPGSLIDYSSRSQYTGTLTFVPASGANLSDYKVSITIN
jgi:hypothetical protein